ncbi:hypothetical protein AB0K80_18045 [Streptomyces sp. NPDC052682]|uniref:hypothetical protein n=1 Tax=Streptomyces sp. NPDC052682 TaxID=3154954 RepID=UPI00342C7BA0
MPDTLAADAPVSDTALAGDAVTADAVVDVTPGRSGAADAAGLAASAGNGRARPSATTAAAQREREGVFMSMP